MKKLLTLVLLLGLFPILAGCEASAEVDGDDDGGDLRLKVDDN